MKRLISIQISVKWWVTKFRVLEHISANAGLAFLLTLWLFHLLSWLFCMHLHHSLRTFRHQMIQTTYCARFTIRPAQIRLLCKSNIINLLLFDFAFNCEILLAFFQWDKNQRLFKESLVSLKAFACSFSDECKSVNWFFLFSFCTSLRLCISVIVVVKHAVVLLFYLVLNLHSSFYLH